MMITNPVMMTIGPIIIALIILAFAYFQPFKKELKQIHPAIFSVLSMGTFISAILISILKTQGIPHDRDAVIASVLLWFAVCLPLSILFSIASLISKHTWYGATLTAILSLPMALLLLKSIVSLLLGLLYYLRFWR